MIYIFNIHNQLTTHKFTGDKIHEQAFDHAKKLLKESEHKTITFFPADEVKKVTISK